MNAIEKLRTAARNVAKGRNLENHEECNLLLVIADEIEAEIAANYMELPKDADGKRVKFGDKLYEDEDGHEFVVSGFKVWGDSFEWWAYQENGIQAPLKRCHIVKPDPLKELLRTFYFNARDVCDTNTGDLDEECAKYADRIRELTGGAR